MQRIMTSTRVLDLFGPGRDGFTDGAIVGAPPTQLEALFFNLVQEEISRLIESAGITLDETRYDQMTLAVQLLIDDRVAPILTNYLPLAGGRMLGVLELDSDPVSDDEAATKRYVDAGIAQISGYLPLAAGAAFPLTGPLYARGAVVIDGFPYAIVADVGGGIYSQTDVWARGNIDADGALSANTLQINATSTLVGKVTAQGVGDFGAGAVAAIEIATASEPALAFHRTGVVATKIGIDALNRFVIGGWSWAAGTLVLDAVGNLTVGGQVFGNTVVANGISSNGYINALAGTITGLNVTANGQCYGTSVVGATVTSNGELHVAGNIWAVYGQMQSNTVVANGITSNGNIAAAAQISSNTVVANGITSNGAIGAAGQVSGGTVVAGGAASTGTTHYIGGLLTAAGGMDVAGGGIIYSNRNANRISFLWPVGGGGGTTALQLWSNNAHVANINTLNTSDERLKDNIGPARGDALDELTRLRLISFDLPNSIDPAQPTVHFDYGFSAQQMEPIIPEAVVGDESLPEDILSLNLMPIVARCVGAIQQLEQRLKTLEGARR